MDSWTVNEIDKKKELDTRRFKSNDVNFEDTCGNYQNYSKFEDFEQFW